MCITQNWPTTTFFDHVDTILAIGSHPDDIEIGCGGTLSKLSNKSIHSIVVTKGELGGNSEVRLRESETSANEYAESFTTLGFKESRISVSEYAIITSIEKNVQKVKPQLVFCHCLDDSHQVHRVIASCSIIASRDVPIVIGYPTPSTLNFRPNLFVRLDEQTIDTKLGLLHNFQTQINKEYMEESFVRGKANVHAVESRSGCEYVEAFQIHRMIA